MCISELYSNGVWESSRYKSVWKKLDFALKLGSYCDWDFVLLILVKDFGW